MSSSCDDRTPYVDLFWLPLGAGDNAHCVRWNGKAFEALSAWRDHRARHGLYHSALEVYVDGETFVIEMAPVWSLREPDRGVVSQGPVGLPLLGRSQLFRYEVRRWRGGRIPDVSYAVDSPQRLSEDALLAERVLDLVCSFPVATWGRDEMRTGDMWNSNSLVSWLLARSGHDLGAVRLPGNGLAPGWDAGLVAAARASAGAGVTGGAGVAGRPRRHADRPAS